MMMRPKLRLRLLAQAMAKVAAPRENVFTSNGKKPHKKYIDMIYIYFLTLNCFYSNRSISNF